MIETKWVVACGARRSGSTLQYNLASEVILLNDGYVHGWTTWQDLGKVIETHDGNYPYVLVKSHAHLPTMNVLCGTLWQQKRGYGVFIHRNMFDTMASVLRLNKANNPAANQERLARLDVVAIVKEINAWLDTTNVLVTAYDDIMSESGKAKECSRIAEHIGGSITDAQCIEIAKDYSLEAQRRSLLSTQNSRGLWPSHISTARTGVWRDELTQEQVDFCDNASQPLHKRLGYKMDKELT